ncbi:uncharacterized, partial [Tachysurus ichikawai]
MASLLLLNDFLRFTDNIFGRKSKQRVEFGRDSVSRVIVCHLQAKTEDEDFNGKVTRFTKKTWMWMT